MQNSLFQAAKVSDDPYLLEEVIHTHVKMRRQAGMRLRAELAERRNENANRRREINSNAALGHNYLNIMRSRVGNLVAGSAGDAMSWKKIKEYGDVDRRMKQFESSEHCEVVDVSSWSKGISTLPSITDRLTANTGTSPVSNLSAKRRRERTLSMRPTRPSGNHLPVVSSRTSAHMIAQVEQDFALLACGSTHIPLSEFDGRSLDASLDCGHRKVFFFEMVDRIKEGTEGYLGFEAFVQLVFSDLDKEELRTAIQRWSIHAWALDLHFATASSIGLLWEEVDKSDTAGTQGSFGSIAGAFGSAHGGSGSSRKKDRPQYVSFSALTKLFGENTVDLETMEEFFDQVDVDADGFITKPQFAKLLSGDLKPPEKPTMHRVQSTARTFGGVFGLSTHSSGVVPSRSASKPLGGMTPHPPHSVHSRQSAGTSVSTAFLDVSPSTARF